MAGKRPDRRRGGNQGRSRHAVKHRWRDYETPSGRRPVAEFIRGLSETDAASVLAAMQEVRDEGLSAARHLEDEIYEVRADGDRVIYRILFATQGSKQRILLALEGIKKKTQKTPRKTITLAKRRLRDWERQGDLMKERKQR